MTCKAQTYADGSWFCPRCEIGGDRDEPVEDYCALNLAERHVKARPSRRLKPSDAPKDG